MTRTVLLAVAAVALVLPACGDDGAEEPVPTSPPTATATETATEVQAEAPEAEEPEPEQQTYRVRSGDTLSSIARRFDTTVRALVRLNDIDNPNKIRAGQELKVPPAR